MHYLSSESSLEVSFLGLQKELGWSHLEINMITVAGTRRLKTAKGSLSLFRYLHPYFRGKPVLADQSYSMEALL